MKNLKEITNSLIGYLDFREARVEFDEDRKRVSIHIDDEVIGSKNIPTLIDSFTRVLKLVAKKYDEGPISVDVNDHYRDKEKMIIELAKAGAKKASVTKTDVTLPPMNSFERHLVHDELATRPDIKTESTGEGTGRRVVIKFID